MAGLVPEDLHAPFRRAALDFQHLRLLEPHQSRVRKIERNGDAGHAVGREPFGRDPGVRSERQAARGQLAVERRDALFEPAAFDSQTEVAEAHIEQLLVGKSGQLRPKGHGRRQEVSGSWRGRTGTRGARISIAGRGPASGRRRDSLIS